MVDSPRLAEAPTSVAGRLRSILGGSAGNLVEWYDWYAYSALTLYFAKVFFPKGDKLSELLGANLVFAVGFFARPLGAWLLGLYADRAGRRASLTLSILLMCAGSLAIALCPGQARIGVAAPVVLVVSRLLQGLSLGGEYGISATYLSEMASKRSRGLWSSLQYITLISGQLVALGVLIVLQALLPEKTIDAWAWRIPFVFGGVLALSVLWLRRGIAETPSYRAVEAKAGRGRVLDLVVRHPKESLMVLALSSGGTLAFYTFTIYIQQFLADTSGLGKVAATRISALGLLLMIPLQPMVGALSDRVGRKPVLIAFGVLGTVFTVPVFELLARTHEPLPAFGLVMALLVIISFYTAINAVVKAELFPAQVRALGVALPLSFANAVFGGTAPALATWLKRQDHEDWFYVYVAAMIALSLAVFVRMRDTRTHSLIVED